MSGAAVTPGAHLATRRAALRANYTAGSNNNNTATTTMGDTASRCSASRIIAETSAHANPTNQRLLLPKLVGRLQAAVR